MTHRIPRVIPIAILLTLAACASGPKVVEDSDPWLANKEPFLRNTRVIGLAELGLPDGLPDPKPIQKNYSDLIETKLRENGLSVVQPQENKAVWDEVVRGLGGIEDSLGRDPQRVARAMVQTLEKLNASCDAVLIPTIKVVEAPFKSGRAAWDGATQSIKSGNVMKNFWAGSPEGKLGALSLYVQILGRDGKTYYEKAGGIEVLSKLSGKEFVLVPRQELFTDKNRNKDAVDIALDPFFD